MVTTDCADYNGDLMSLLTLDIVAVSEATAGNVYDIHDPGF